MLRFFWNGIKGADGKLQRASYSMGSYAHHPKGTITITIYAKSGTTFSDEVRQHFAVENNSESRTDYFEWDHARVLPDHPLYAQVSVALETRKERRLFAVNRKMNAQREGRYREDLKQECNVIRSEIADIRAARNN